jgi:hypothetical protein
MNPTPDSDARDGRTNCRTCNSQVSHQFARVFGDNDDVIFACPNCATMAELPHLASGAGRDDRG